MIADVREQVRQRRLRRTVARAYDAATTPGSGMPWGTSAHALFVPPVRAEHPELVHLSDGVIVLEGCWMSVVPTFDDVRPRLVLGRGVHIGRGCQLSVVGSVVVEDGALIGDFVQIGDTFHDYEAEDRMPVLVRPREVVIGAGAVIGGHATVLPGVTVGAGAVVDHHAVVGADVAPGTRVRGNPARPA